MIYYNLFILQHLLLQSLYITNSLYYNIFILRLLLLQSLYITNSLYYNLFILQPLILQTLYSRYIYFNITYTIPLYIIYLYILTSFITIPPEAWSGEGAMGAKPLDQ